MCVNLILVHISDVSGFFLEPGVTCQSLMDLPWSQWSVQKKERLPSPKLMDIEAWNIACTKLSCLSGSCDHGLESSVQRKPSHAQHVYEQLEIKETKTAQLWWSANFWPSKHAVPLWTHQYLSIRKLAFSYQYIWSPKGKYRLPLQCVLVWLTKLI
jgi:hypothetical protein